MHACNLYGSSNQLEYKVIIRWHSLQLKYKTGGVDGHTVDGGSDTIYIFTHT